tara:strand:- start:2 stop:460 length:459 start_codon:yes stop_codon:yes gene_type:complete
MDRYLKLKEKLNMNYQRKQTKLQSKKKNKKLSKPQRIVYKHISKTPATLDQISRSIHEKSIQNIKRILANTRSFDDNNKNDDYFPKLEETTKRVKVTLKNLEKMNKVVNKNGKYSIVTEFASRKKNFKPKKSPLRKMKRKSNSNSNSNTKRK